MKSNTMHDMTVIAGVIIAAIFTGVLTFIIVYLPDKYADEAPVIDLESVDAGEVDDKWADDIIQWMRESRRHYRECHEALCKCVGQASFAVPAVDRLVKNHPELRSEIMDLWTQYYVSDAGCCEIEKDDERFIKE